MKPAPPRRDTDVVGYGAEGCSLFNPFLVWCPEHVPDPGSFDPAQRITRLEARHRHERGDGLVCDECERPLLEVQSTAEEIP